MHHTTESAPDSVKVPRHVLDDLIAVSRRYLDENSDDLTVSERYSIRDAEDLTWKHDDLRARRYVR